MGYFKQPIVTMFLGYPGSGKSYFAKAMADKINAVRINGDSMRMAMFGSREETKRIYDSGDRCILNNYVFNGLDYVAEQILLRGNDVVYDAHQNKREDREKIEQIAKRHHALPIVVWIKTPYEVALKRGQEREESVDQRRLTEAEMREVMDRHQANTDTPTDEELVITIDGEAPFEQQFKQFCDQLDNVMVARGVA